MGCRSGSSRRDEQYSSHIGNFAASKSTCFKRVRKWQNFVLNQPQWICLIWFEAIVSVVRTWDNRGQWKNENDSSRLLNFPQRFLPICLPDTFLRLPLTQCVVVDKQYYPLYTVCMSLIFHPTIFRIWITLPNMNNIANILTSAQIATALIIIAFVVVFTLLHRELHRHK